MAITMAKISDTAFTFADLALTAVRTLGQEWTASNLAAHSAAANNPVTLLHKPTGTAIGMRVIPDVFGDYSTIELDGTRGESCGGLLIATEETETLGVISTALVARATEMLLLLDALPATEALFGLDDCC